ncbi:nuclear transport factor 2 family protein [Streptomyces sp. NBC_01244]|uniref:nuclear transport factor 2 family protein n=1 Tax=Streptomyces sp. NBC_01244 TaxID=2903797 RepID=UPI002E14E72D|nr:nuclear transport factor 2 family protein [Streptomyces sp. NBC_01244]
MIRGWRALDRKDWHAWIACWAEDAVLEFGPWGEIHGREAVRAKVEEAEAHFPSMQHHILNMDFQVEGIGRRAWGTCGSSPSRAAGRALRPTPWAVRTTGTSAGAPRAVGSWSARGLASWWTDGDEPPGGLG